MTDYRLDKTDYRILKILQEKTVKSLTWTSPKPLDCHQHPLSSESKNLNRQGSLLHTMLSWISKQWVFRLRHSY